ncbi:ankyrin repeat-containing domain protein [Rhexocercosporidium sp. MPI-PUGE-AT-0058]|nr:ankyrin repeat-containing domain protein [Rhexocercosporidium sp. MPI-PUGE-AT-0058]
MDSLSGAASVIAVIDISAKIFELCQTYVSAVKEARKDIQRLRDGVTSLQDVMTDVRDLAEDSSFSTRSIFSHLNQHNGPVQQCERDLRRLVAQLELGEGESKMRQFGLRALKWPFSSKDIDRRLQIINDHKATFTLALSSDNFALTRSIKDDIARLGDSLADIQIEQMTLAMGEKQQKIRHWLSSPDPSSNHNAACKARQATTGEWFLKSDEFEEWKITSRSFLWLYGIRNLHVLATSRRERDIEETLESLTTSEICLQSALVDNDIRTHISERLQNDLKLKRWPANVRGEIEDTLIEGAQGIINEDYRQDAFRILQWLVYSARPLRIEELVKVIAIDTEQSQFNPENRLPDPRDLLTICSSLVTTISVTAEGNDGASNETTELKLAHFSVKEYLISDRIRNRLAFQYDIQSRGEEEIAQSCLAYLLYFQRGILTSENLNTFPLALYAAEHWCRHFRAMKDSDQATKLGMQLFQRDTFMNWIRLFDPDNPWERSGINRDITSIASPLYYASRKSLFQPVSLLLEERVDVNAQGGYYGNALQAALAGGHEAIAILLLEKGADVNAQGGEYGNALQAASAGGHEAIAVLLLEKGAGVNAQGRVYGSALQAASTEGHEAITVLLLKKGADVNAQGGQYGNALQAASAGCHEAIAILLLEKGADVNTQGGYYGNALQAASAGGHEAIVVLLLEKGADVNTQSGHYGNALQAASAGGHEAIAVLLLEKGADVNTQGGEYGNALQAASAGGHEAIAVLLLEKGADVNTQGGYYGNALQAASAGGHEAIAVLLLEKGADMNTQGEEYGNALQAASARGHEAILVLLLEKGADMNTQGGHYGNALQAASAGGHEAIAVLLLEKGADVNTQSGHYGSALQAASTEGHEAITVLLLEKGADVNAQSGHYGSALQAALAGGHEAIVALLFKKEAITENMA